MYARDNGCKGISLYYFIPTSGPAMLQVSVKPSQNSSVSELLLATCTVTSGCASKQPISKSVSSYDPTSERASDSACCLQTADLCKQEHVSANGLGLGMRLSACVLQASCALLSLQQANGISYHAIKVRCRSLLVCAVCRLQSF